MWSASGGVELISLYFNAGGWPFASIRYQNYTGVYEYQAVQYLTTHADSGKDRLALLDICDEIEACKYGKLGDITL